MQRLIPLALALLLLTMTALSQQPDEGYRIIVHNDNPLRAVSRDFLSKAFLKKVREWPDGELILPVDLRASTEPRQRFTKGVLRRSTGAVKSYWQQQIFSGRDVPPLEVDSDAQAVTYVRRNRGGLAYVSEAVDISGVKVLTIR